MKPGFTIESINHLDMYVITPTRFMAKALSKKQMEAFVKKINKAWEELK